jgi:hypothetical protein
VAGSGAGHAHAGWLVGIAAAVALGTAVREALAEPQASVGLTGGATLRDPTATDRGLSLHLGGRADVLFLRDHNGQMALGPYVDGATAGFQDVDLGGGLEWLLPLTTDVPLVVSGGGLVRNGDGRSWAPGLEGTAFVGSRSFNFHSWYGLTAGLFAQVRWVPESPSAVDLILGVQLDLEVLALPALFLWDAASHGS